MSRIGNAPIAVPKGVKVNDRRPRPSRSRVPRGNLSFDRALEGISFSPIEKDGDSV